MDVQQLIVHSGDSLRDAMARINRAGTGVVCLVDEQQRFVTTITDGDIRRAILGDSRLDSPVDDIVAFKRSQGREAIVGSIGMSEQEQALRMRAEEIRHLPLLDERGRLADVGFLDTIPVAPQLPVKAVIMAGGFGTRLRPLTDSLPKPMLPIAGKPLLERTICSLRKAGIRRIDITTHYMPEKIINYFGDGDDFDVELNYLSEEEPLGTAGSLRLVGESEQALLVMDGDVFTQVDFQSLLKFHRERQAELSIGVRHYELQVPYGVVEAENGLVEQLREKPSYDFLVNAGVYLLEPSVRRIIPADGRFDMTDLIEQLLRAGRTVASFPIVEYWIDIGHPDDLQRAQNDARELRWSA